MNRVTFVGLTLLVSGCYPDPPTRVACFAIVETALDDVRDAFVVAELRTGTVCPYEEPPPRGCTVVHTPERPFWPDEGAVPPPPPGVSASGVDLVLRGLGSDVVLDRRESGLFDAALLPVPAGTTLAFSGVFEGVLPFSSAETIAPGVPVLSVPARVEPGEDLVLTWEPPPGEPEMTILVSDTLLPFGGRGTTIRCVMDPSLGEISIGPHLLGELDTHGTDTPLVVTATYHQWERHYEHGVDSVVDLTAQFIGPAIAR